MRLLTLSVFLFAIVMQGCGEREESIAASGEPRFPDDQGIVTDINFSVVELDGERRLPILEEVESFSTYTRRAQPLLSWKDKYVHVGLDREGGVRWIAGIGVLDRTMDPPAIHYTGGLLIRIDRNGKAIFEDGTVLQLGSALERPPPGSTVRATIDPAKHEVIDVAWEADRG